MSVCDIYRCRNESTRRVETQHFEGHHVATAVMYMCDDHERLTFVKHLRSPFSLTVDSRPIMGGVR